MDKFTELRNKLSAKPDKSSTESSSGLGWEIGAYSIRGISVALPAVIIMFLENSWVKTGLGLLATILIIAMVIIFREPIKKAMGYAPGVVPFTVFVIIAIFFNTTANALMTIGISGLGGSIVSIPLHLKYISMQKGTKTPEQILLENIANKITKT